MKPLLVAHRGGALEAFENSISAFKHALAIGCDSIEVDLRATRDGKIVVIHDETFERTASGHGKIRDIPFKEMQPLRLKNGEPIPMLEDVLRLAKKRLSLHLEVKEPGFEKSLVSALEATEMLTSVFVISFHTDLLEKIHRLNPDIEVGFLFAKESDWKDCPPCCELALPPAELVNEQTVLNFKRKGKRIHTWVVNEPSQAKRLVSLGVDGIITDRPQALKANMTLMGTRPNIENPH